MTTGAVTALRGGAKTPTQGLRDLRVRRQKLRPKWSKNPSDTRIERSAVAHLGHTRDAEPNNSAVIAPLTAEESRALAQALEPLPPQEMAGRLNELRLLTKARARIRDCKSPPT